ncbi:MAG: VOC family protein [Holdemanella sp.]|nr:VOC family protein [Holdemanella sp.]
MHIAFFTDKMDEMIDFYTNKLGCKVKVCVKYKQYLNRDDRPQMQAMALKDPEAIFNVYMEICEGQYIELFPKQEGMLERDTIWNSRLGYSHFALTVDDIYKTREELAAKGCEFDTDISIGPSQTYQMWMQDPDGNKFEIMQYTDKSYQITGHLD